MKRIYLVHRDAAFAMRACAAFDKNDMRVEVYRNPDMALSAFFRRPPDALILDIGDHNLEGIRVMQKVRSSSILPIVLLTNDVEEIDPIIGLRLGADAVLGQQSSTHLLTEWVRSLIKRHQELLGVGMNGKMIEKTFKGTDLVMEPTRMTAVWRDMEVSLTPTEFKLLFALASRPGVVKSREALIELIHDNTDEVYDRSVDSHVKRIRAKLREVDPAFNGIRSVYGMGYRFIEKGADGRPDANSIVRTFPTRPSAMPDDVHGLPEVRAVG
jgi:two-component system response regulator ChvI